MIWTIIETLFYLVMFVHAIGDLMFVIRERKYQKIWNKEKAMRMRIDPAITKAELCEYFVMFCKRNSCKVDF